MKLIYTNENSLLVENIKNLLENSGIDVHMRNQYAGGAKGELPVFHTWPEIWIVHENDIARAENIMSELNKPTDEVNWICPRCIEENDGNFACCWNCQAEMPQ